MEATIIKIQYKKCPRCGEILELGETCYCNEIRERAYEKRQGLPWHKNTYSHNLKEKYPGKVIVSTNYLKTDNGEIIYILNYDRRFDGAVVGYEVEIYGENGAKEKTEIISASQYKYQLKAYLVRQTYKTKDGKKHYTSIGTITAFGNKSLIKRIYASRHGISADGLSIVGKEIKVMRW